MKKTMVTASMDTVSIQEIDNRIFGLQLELMEAYEKQGITKEVVEISQELDHYIFLAQHRLKQYKG